MYIQKGHKVCVSLTILRTCKQRTQKRFFWGDATGPHWARASFTRFLDHTQRGITVSRTPLDEWSVCHRYLYLTTHNTHNRQTFMPLVGFEPTITAGERPQTYALNRAATGTGRHGIIECIFVECGELLSRIFTQKSWIGCNIIVRC